MIVFVATQMSAPKRKSPQSVIIKLQIEGINVFHLSHAHEQSKDTKVRLTKCQSDTNSNLNSSNKT